MRFLHTTVLALCALSAQANDTLVTLGAGGLVPVKSAQIVMEREDLTVSVKQISVHYLFRNNSDHDLDVTVAFPMPELDGGQVAHEPLNLPSRPGANFMGFEVLVAGKRIEPRLEVRAFHDGRDITDRLRAAGLPVSVIDESFASAVSRLTPQQRRDFAKDELVVSDEPEPQKTFWANWNTRIQFYWTQHFPAHAVVDVVHRYRPVVGGSYIVATDNGAEHIKPYCGSADSVALIQDFKKQHAIKNEIALYEKRIRYILTTANNWSGPIRDFHLTVTANSPDNIVLSCLAGLKRLSPTSYAFSQANFHPDRELDLLILQGSR